MYCSIFLLQLVIAWSVSPESATGIIQPSPLCQFFLQPQVAPNVHSLSVVSPKVVSFSLYIFLLSMLFSFFNYAALWILRLLNCVSFTWKSHQALFRFFLPVLQSGNSLPTCLPSSPGLLSVWPVVYYLKSVISCVLSSFLLLHLS